MMEGAAPTAEVGPHPSAILRMVPLPICDGEEFAGAALRLAGLAALHFGWRPAEFWAATPAELAAIAAVMLHPETHAAPPDRATLHRLMEAFPDG